MIEDGSLGLALFAGFAFLGGLIVETRVLLRWRWSWYFSLNLPVVPPLVPIPTAPEGSGRTETVHWEVVEPGLVFWWADPDERSAPSGLHGVVNLMQTPAGAIAMDVRWAPPLSPVLAVLWLGALGAVRGEAHLTVPIALAMLAGIAVVYFDRARRAARELRWSFVKGERG